MRWGSGSTALLALATAGCQWIVGPLGECRTDSDCLAKGPTVVCQSTLCVKDPRCSSVGSADPNALRFGFAVPLTTDGTTPDPNGPIWVDEVSLVLDALNPPVQTGIGGRAIGVTVCDTMSDPRLTGLFAQRFVDAGMAAMMSCGSSETLNAAAVTVPARVLLLSGYSQAASVTFLSASPNGVRLVWRTMPPDPFIASILIRSIAGAPGPDGGTLDGGAAPRVAVLARNDAYGQDFYGLFSPAYPGPQRAFFFDPSGADDAAGLAGAVQFAPEVVVMWAFPEDITRLLNVADAPAYAALTQVPWYFNDQFLVPGTLGGLTHPARAEGWRSVAAATGDTTSPAFAWLQQQSEGPPYAIDPSQAPSAAATADAMMLIAVAAGANAVAGNPLDGTHLAKMLVRMSAPDAGQVVPLDPPNFTRAVSALAAGQTIHVQGASGPLDFDPKTGETPSVIDIYQVVDGGFAIVQVVHP